MLNDWGIRERATAVVEVRVTGRAGPDVADPSVPLRSLETKKTKWGLEKNFLSWGHRRGFFSLKKKQETLNTKHYTHELVTYYLEVQVCLFPGPKSSFKDDGVTWTGGMNPNFVCDESCVAMMCAVVLCGVRRKT